jgi:hypothetical protein
MGSRLNVGFTGAIIGQFPAQLAVASQRSGTECIGSINEPAGIASAKKGAGITVRRSTIAVYAVFLVLIII